MCAIIIIDFLKSRINNRISKYINTNICKFWIILWKPFFRLLSSVMWGDHNSICVWNNATTTLWETVWKCRLTNSGSTRVHELLTNPRVCKLNPNLIQLVDRRSINLKWTWKVHVLYDGRVEVECMNLICTWQVQAPTWHSSGGRVHELYQHSTSACTWPALSTGTQVQLRSNDQGMN